MDETEPEVNTSIQVERTGLDAKKFAPSTGAAFDKPQPCPPAASESRWPLSPARPIAAINQIAGKFFWPRASAMLNALAGEHKLEAFFNCWTRKEAYLKATGEGIADALAQIEVSLAPGPAAQLLHVAGDARVASSWSLHPLAPTPGFTGAVAVKARDLKLACWRWPENFPAARSLR